MKKRLSIVLIVSLFMILCGCEKSVYKEKTDLLGRTDVAIILSRARYDGDIDKIYEYTPNVFLSDELKRRYVKKINCEGIAYRKLIGVQNLKYQIVNAGVRTRIFDELASDYGIDDELRNDVSNAGYITYDIVMNDDKGNKKIVKNKDLAFLYEEQWYIIVLDEY